MTRHHFVGFHVTKPVRDFLRSEAKARKISVSMLVYQLVLEKFQLSDQNNPSLEELCQTIDSSLVSSSNTKS